MSRRIENSGQSQGRLNQHVIDMMRSGFVEPIIFSLIDEVTAAPCLNAWLMRLRREYHSDSTGIGSSRFRQTFDPEYEFIRSKLLTHMSDFTGSEVMSEKEFFDILNSNHSGVTQLPRHINNPLANPEYARIIDRLIEQLIRVVTIRSVERIPFDHYLRSISADLSESEAYIDTDTDTDIDLFAISMALRTVWNHLVAQMYPSLVIDMGSGVGAEGPIFSINDVDDEGYTLLHHALESGHFACASMCLILGADPWTRNTDNLIACDLLSTIQINSANPDMNEFKDVLSDTLLTRFPEKFRDFSRLMARPANREVASTYRYLLSDNVAYNIGTIDLLIQEDHQLWCDYKLKNNYIIERFPHETLAQIVQKVFSSGVEDFRKSHLFEETLFVPLFDRHKDEWSLLWVHYERHRDNYIEVKVRYLNFIDCTITRIYTSKHFNERACKRTHSDESQQLAARPHTGCLMMASIRHILSELTLTEETLATFDTDTERQKDYHSLVLLRKQQYEDAASGPSTSSRPPLLNKLDAILREFQEIDPSTSSVDCLAKPESYPIALCELAFEAARTGDLLLLDALLFNQDDRERERDHLEALAVMDGLEASVPDAKGLYRLILSRIWFDQPLIYQQKRESVIFLLRSGYLEQPEAFSSEEAFIEAIITAHLPVELGDPLGNILLSEWLRNTKSAPYVQALSVVNVENSDYDLRYPMLGINSASESTSTRAEEGVLLGNPVYYFFALQKLHNYSDEINFDRINAARSPEGDTILHHVVKLRSMELVVRTLNARAHQLIFVGNNEGITPCQILLTMKDMDPPTELEKDNLLTSSPHGQCFVDSSSDVAVHPDNKLALEWAMHQDERGIIKFVRLHEVVEGVRQPAFGEESPETSNPVAAPAQPMHINEAIFSYIVLMLFADSDYIGLDKGTVLTQILSRIETDVYRIRKESGYGGFYSWLYGVTEVSKITRRHYIEKVYHAAALALFTGDPTVLQEAIATAEEGAERHKKTFSKIMKRNARELDYVRSHRHFGQMNPSGSSTGTTNTSQGTKDDEPSSSAVKSGKIEGNADDTVTIDKHVLTEKDQEIAELRAQLAAEKAKNQATSVSSSSTSSVSIFGNREIGSVDDASDDGMDRGSGVFGVKKGMGDT